MERPAAEPYVGPRPFAREDASRFFGREGEAADLASLVLAHRVLVLYAPSGAGKSSLLAAKVLPELSGPERGARVLGPARVSGELPAGEVANAFAFHALASLGVEVDAARRGEFASVLERWIGERDDASDAPAVLVLDQFEELFTRHPERWRDRAPFFRALGEASERLPSLRVLLSMREEHLAQLVPFARFLPENLRGRFRLERLRREAALEAIVRPLDGFERRFAPGAAERLVESLLRVPVEVDGETREVEGEFVEPVQLQVVCQRLWRSLPPDAKEIDEGAVQTRGGVDEALGAYYDECIARIASEAAENEGRLRRWIEDALLTTEGTRALVHRGATHTAELANAAVERMEASHLLRAELRGGSTFYELAHDRLLGPARKSNRRFREHQMTAQPELAAAEARAKEWDLAGRPALKLTIAQYVFDSRSIVGELRSLERLKRLAKQASAGGLTPSRALLDFVEVHGEAWRTVATRFFGAVILFLFLLAAALFAGVLYTVDLKGEADSARRDAERARAHAEHALELELGHLAREFSAEDARQLDALELGLRAVLPALTTDRAPAPEAEAGLRAAVEKTLRRAPLWTGVTATSEVALAAGGRLAVAWNRAQFVTFDCATGAVRGTWDVFRGERAAGAAPSTDGERVWMLTAEIDSGTARHGVAGGSAVDAPRELHLLEYEASGIPRRMVYLSNGERLLYADADHGRAYLASTGHVRIASPGGEIQQQTFELSLPAEIVVAPDGARAVLSGLDKAKLVDLSAGASVVDLGKVWRGGVGFSPDSKRLACLAAALSDDSVECRIYSAITGELLSTGVTALVDAPLDWFGYLPSSERLMALVSEGGASRSTRAVRFDADTGEVLSVGEYPGPLIAFAERPQRFLVAGSNGEWGAIWDPITDALVPLDLDTPLSGTDVDVQVDARVETIAITRNGQHPELFWPLRDARVPDDLQTMIDIACDRLRGRPEYAELLGRVEAARR